MVAKVTFATICLMAAGLAVAQAAGIKGLRGADDSQRVAAKGIARPAAFLPPPPPQQAPLALARPILQQAPIKGPGQIAPVFTASRVAPLAPLAPQVQQVQQIRQEQDQLEPAIVQQQPQQQLVQQQQEEIDPNAAGADAAPAVLAPARVGAAASEEEANPRPEPYSFQYSFDSGDQSTSGSSQREETQDANGRVTGFYTLRGEDGRDRRVDYVADASGFRATVSTNEMGTSPKDSADVDWNAQQPSDGQLRAAESATQAARQRELANPQQQQLESGSDAQSSRQTPSLVSKQHHHVRHHHNHQQQQQLAAAGSSSGQQAAYGQQQQLQAGNAPSFAAAAPSKANQAPRQQQAQFVPQQQLREPFEQIRQTELNSARARKSRHAPFYLFTI